jgi:hypothetical protein
MDEPHARKLASVVLTKGEDKNPCVKSLAHCGHVDPFENIIMAEGEMEGAKLASLLHSF